MLTFRPLIALFLTAMVLPAYAWDQQTLLRLARTAIEAEVQGGSLPHCEEESPSRAVFVTIEPTLYRPILRRLGGSTPAIPVVNPYDFSRPGESELIRRILLAAKPGSVILLHAGVAESRAVVPRVLSALRQRGFSFGVLR